MRTQKETDLQAQVVKLQARVEELEGALQKIRTEPGDTRDCRYIAGHALAATEQECEHEWGTRTGGFLIHCRKCGDIQTATEEGET